MAIAEAQACEARKAQLEEQVTSGDAAMGDAMRNAAEKRSEAEAAMSEATDAMLSGRAMGAR